MRTMEVIIDSQGKSTYTPVPLRVGENDAVDLQITLPEEYDDLSHFIRIKLNDNDSYVTPQIVPTDRILKYTIPDACTFEQGILKMEVQSFNVDDLLVKTSLILIPVVGSLDGSDVEIPPSYLEYIQILDIIGYYVEKAGDTMTGRLILPELQISGGEGDQGLFSWNDTDWTVDLNSNGSVIQIGQETLALAQNKSGVTIPNGKAVMYTGSIGASGRAAVALMIADGSIPEGYFVGIATEEIPDNDFGMITHYGKVRGIDTTAWNEGDVLYLDPITPGNLTNVKPEAPYFKNGIAIVISSSVNGTIQARVSHGSNLNDVNDVSITDPQDGDVLKYNATTGVWYNTQP